MPTYDYKCKDCQKPFEIEKGMDEKLENLKCPSCSSLKVNRIFNSIRLGHSEKDLIDKHGTSGGSCSTCIDGVCSTCSSKK